MTYRILLFISLSMIMMAIDYQRNYLDNLRAVFYHLIYPIQYIVDLPFSSINWVQQVALNKKSLLEENERLKAQDLINNQKLQQFNILEHENQRLRKLLNMSSRLEKKIVAAELLSIELGVNRHQIVLNKGKQDNITIGQTVADGYGIMGQVVQISAFSSAVLLITDSTHALPIKINHNGYRAIASGTGRYNVLKLENVPNNINIKKGDLVISSGLGGRFPKDYPVGIIKDIKHSEDELFADITITPSAQFEHSNQVLIIGEPTAQKENSNELPNQ